NDLIKEMLPNFAHGPRNLVISNVSLGSYIKCKNSGEWSLIRSNYT
ncbi:13732_t:CDS:1, partial [Cetraspora pellucida]